MSTKLFIDKNFPTTGGFLNNITTDFHASTHKVNFKYKPDQANRTVNKWIKWVTRDKITDLLGAGNGYLMGPPTDDFLSVGVVTEKTRVIFVNTLYFSGQWKKQFNPHYTKKAKFHVNSKVTMEIPMMHMTGVFHYVFLEDLKASAIELLYKLNIHDIFNDVLVSGVSAPRGQLGVTMVMQGSHTQLNERGTTSATATSAFLLVTGVKTLQNNDTTALRAVADGNGKLLIDFHQSHTNLTLNLAEAMFVETQYRLNEDFVKSVEKYFLADVEPVDFVSAPSDAADVINHWVSNHTNNKIENLFSSDSFDYLTRFVVTNAVYFQGTWKISFDKSETRKQSFYMDSVNFVDMDMMHVTGDFAVSSSHELQANILELQYTDEEVKMLIVLPYDKDGLSSTVQRLTNLDQVSAGTFPQTVQLTLPKFNIETTLDLIQTMKQLGIEDVFNDQSDLSGITSSNRLYLDTFVQKAFIKVTEEGAEAGAATGDPLLCRQNLEAPGIEPRTSVSNASNSDD
uniref:Serpin domain-containing protein n=1 Tax=Timema cristinae TaxID=61476 RepID=A0A7R9GTE3_TIMCR|nr:unnamed protein product [Timema cristinae]